MGLGRTYQVASLRWPQIKWLVVLIGSFQRFLGGLFGVDLFGFRGTSFFICTTHVAHGISIYPSGAIAQRSCQGKVISRDAASHLYKRLNGTALFYRGFYGFTMNRGETMKGYRGGVPRDRTGF